MNQRESRAFANLIDMGVPRDRAEWKIQSTRRGWLVAFAGAFIIALAFGFIIFMVIVTKGAPNVALLVFASLLALPGAYFILAGGHLISGDAMHAAEESGDAIAKTAAKLLRAARPKEDA